ncbi:MAG TPA: formaldehyde-activating enzyme [Acidimicrobiales bacterium]|nr:formaldehyde-activating enzyme [Acidimicrobiales bacterium]
MAAFVTQLGEAFCGAGPEAAHVNTVLGAKGGPVEAAWVTALATPRKGHVAFVVAAQPSLAVKPMTLFVNKATIATDDHAALTWGPAQAGVASGVLDAVADGTVPAALADELVLIVAVWLSAEARDADAVYGCNREATHASLRAGALGHPTPGDVLAVREDPYNAYWLPPSMR